MEMESSVACGPHAGNPVVTMVGLGVALMAAAGMAALKYSQAVIEKIGKFETMSIYMLVNAIR